MQCCSMLAWWRGEWWHSRAVDAFGLVFMESLEKRRLQNDLIAAFQNLKGILKKGETFYTGIEACERTRGNVFKLKE